MRRYPQYDRPIPEPSKVRKYQRMSDGSKVKPTDPARAIWYGPCGFWTDEWDTLAATINGIPCCPTCGAPGYIIEASDWFAGLDRYELEHPEDPGYRTMVMSHFNSCDAQLNVVEEIRV